MSAWASTQITPPGPPWARASPPSVPMEIEWSPPRMSGNAPRSTAAAISSANCSQVLRMASQ